MQFVFATYTSIKLKKRNICKKKKKKTQVAQDSNPGCASVSLVQAPKVIGLPFPLCKIKELNHKVSDAPPILRISDS